MFSSINSKLIAWRLATIALGIACAQMMLWTNSLFTYTWGYTDAYRIMHSLLMFFMFQIWILRAGKQLSLMNAMIVGMLVGYFAHWPAAAVNYAYFSGHLNNSISRYIQLEGLGLRWLEPIVVLAPIRGALVGVAVFLLDKYIFYPNFCKQNEMRGDG